MDETSLNADQPEIIASAEPNDLRLIRAPGLLLVRASRLALILCYRFIVLRIPVTDQSERAPIEPLSETGSGFDGAATLDWVSWYNERRLLEPIGYIPPVELEQVYDRNQAALAMVAGVN